jgi:hypothetical protein
MCPSLGPRLDPAIAPRRLQAQSAPGRAPLWSKVETRLGVDRAICRSRSAASGPPPSARAVRAVPQRRWAKPARQGGYRRWLRESGIIPATRGRLQLRDPVHPPVRGVDHVGPNGPRSEPSRHTDHTSPYREGRRARVTLVIAKQRQGDNSSPVTVSVTSGTSPVSTSREPRWRHPRRRSSPRSAGTRVTPSSMSAAGSERMCGRSLRKWAPAGAPSPS